jgi:fumarate reductase flavoprotein subunit
MRADYLLYTLSVALGLMSAPPGFASGAKHIINVPHSRAHIACVACHETRSPRKAAKAAACIGCHGDMSRSKTITVFENKIKVKINPHESHVSPLDCTQCHRIHRKSRLYCNKCHQFRKVVVP